MCIWNGEWYLDIRCVITLAPPSNDSRTDSPVFTTWIVRWNTAAYKNKTTHCGIHAPRTEKDNELTTLSVQHLCGTWWGTPRCLGHAPFGAEEHATCGQSDIMQCRSAVTPSKLHLSDRFSRARVVAMFDRLRTYLGDPGFVYLCENHSTSD